MEPRWENLKKLDDALREFLHGKTGPPVSADDLEATYMRSPAYLQICSQFHREDSAWQAMDWLMENAPAEASLIEVGCLAGFAGLQLALMGWRVTFHDYENMGLEFVRWFAQRERLEVRIVPYGEGVERHDWALAFDVLEHTGNVFGTLKWLKELGDKVVLTYPVVPYLPPFKRVLDQWIDHEALMLIIEKRHQILLRRERRQRKVVVFQ